MHRRWQTGLILQRCYQQFFRLWTVEGNLAEELIDDGIDHPSVSWEFLGGQLRCARILSVLCSSSQGYSSCFLIRCSLEVFQFDNVPCSLEVFHVAVCQLSLLNSTLQIFQFKSCNRLLGAVLGRSRQV